MYNTKDLQDAIIQLKKEKDVCILAHAYQTQDILEVADFIGDSFGLSQQAQNAPQKTLLMCGVRFMAETAKILSPDKKVILSHPDAGCPMEEQPISCIYSHRRNGFGGSFSRYSRILSGGEYIWLSTSEMRSL